MKFNTLVEESGIKYSIGGDFDEAPNSMTSMAFNTLFLFIPASITDPDSSASGLSIEFLIVTALNPKITASSETEPLSESTNREFFCNLQ